MPLPVVMSSSTNVAIAPISPTIIRPTNAHTVWAFVGLMMVGLMGAIATFVLLLITTGSGNYTSWNAWLPQAGLFSLGALLSGIVLALYSIGNVLGFQFTRIRDIIKVGR